MISFTTDRRKPLWQHKKVKQDASALTAGAASLTAFNLAVDSVQRDKVLRVVSCLSRMFTNGELKMSGHGLQQKFIDVEKGTFF